MGIFWEEKNCLKRKKNEENCLKLPKEITRPQDVLPILEKFLKSDCSPRVIRQQTKDKELIKQTFALIDWLGIKNPGGEFELFWDEETSAPTKKLADTEIKIQIENKTETYQVHPFILSQYCEQTKNIVLKKGSKESLRYLLYFLYLSSYNNQLHAVMLVQVQVCTGLYHIKVVML